AAFATLGSLASAQLQVRSIDFESADPASPGTGISDLGFVNYVTVFDPSGGYLFGYGTFAPNNTELECALLVSGLGTPSNGQSLQTNSNYNNGGEHGNGNILESNTFFEQNISADSFGDTWTLDFDYLKANCDANPAGTTTAAFIKVLDPASGFATVYYDPIDTTGADCVNWTSASTSILIDAAWGGHILQVGFTNRCSNFDDSRRVYDNIEWQGPPPPPPTMNPYAQDFDGLDINDTNALINEGWLIFANVFDPAGGYLYGYGPFGAPNENGPGFSDLSDSQQAADQGSQSLVVYSDYNNGDHGNGNYIEASVYKEQAIQTANLGQSAIFSFDVKKSDFVNNGQGDAEMFAFIKVLDSVGGSFGTLRDRRISLTDNSIRNWDNVTITMELDPSLDGQLFQFGFGSYASNYDDTGVYYDNIDVSFVDIDEIDYMTFAEIEEGTTLWNPEFATDSGVGFACGIGGSDVWFVYFAESNSEIQVDTAGTDFDTVLQVFDAVTGTLLNCHDDVNFPADPTSALSFAGTAGNPYAIHVSGWNVAGVNFGDGILNIREGLGSQICSAQANASGAGAVLTANGSPAAADNNLTLDVRELPANQTGYFLTSSDATFLANPAGSAGDLCIASLSIGRYASDVQTSDSGGAVSFPVDLTAIPGPTGSSTAMAGETRFFQYWSRDTAGGNPTSNFSTAVSLTFQ
ncbi:MAG: hypothetical protein P8R46_00140, partial [Planctomycetota bacterium]|nr:hypothetical protein [Planctomycetota bacterium]